MRGSSAVRLSITLTPTLSRQGRGRVVVFNLFVSRRSSRVHSPRPLRAKPVTPLAPCGRGAGGEGQQRCAALHHPHPNPLPSRERESCRFQPVRFPWLLPRHSLSHSRAKPVAPLAPCGRGAGVRGFLAAPSKSPLRSSPNPATHRDSKISTAENLDLQTNRSGVDRIPVAACAVRRRASMIKRHSRQIKSAM